MKCGLESHRYFYFCTPQQPFSLYTISVDKVVGIHCSATCFSEIPADFERFARVLTGTIATSNELSISI